jgi:carbon-monoxide dehydrogenase small subunit
MADLHASAEYRRRVATSLAIRAVNEAAGNAVGWATAPADASPRGQIRTQAHVDSDANAILPTLRVNGASHPIDVEPRMTLLDCLRDTLGLNGAHAGCEHGVCGACTVLVDGLAVRSCLMFAVQADGRAITTIEGLTPAPGELSVLQDAFCETHGLQCGYCTPAMILAAHALLAGNPSPTRDDIIDAISGNICRCTGYAQIVEAVALAAERLRGANRPIEP